MQMSDDEREQLVRNGYYAMVRVLAGDRPVDAIVAPWDTVASKTQDALRAFAAALLPEGTVCLPRDRVQRLIRFARYLSDDGGCPIEDLCGLEFGDLDPLPEGA